MEHPAVLEAVSFADSHATLGESVGAAVVLRENTRVTEAEIRKFAATRLAHFKMPGLLAIVPEIPKDQEVRCSATVWRNDWASQFPAACPRARGLLMMGLAHELRKN